MDESGESESPFFCVLTHFITDSVELGKYLCQEYFRSGVQSTGPVGLYIRLAATDWSPGVTGTVPESLEIRIIDTQTSGRNRTNNIF